MTRGWQALVEMGPSFFRFPGGNNLEGQTAATRWQWNTTVGSLLDRPGRSGDWGYINTECALFARPGVAAPDVVLQRSWSS